MEKYMLINMIDSYWTQGQSETTTVIEWFHSGDQDSSKVRNKSDHEKPSMQEVECSILL